MQALKIKEEEDLEVRTHTTVQKTINALIGKYALENGNIKAIWKFKE